MKPCPKCGKPVRLGAHRISMNRKRGVYHYIAHMESTGCDAAQEFTCVALKPYQSPKEYEKLIERWNAQ